MFGLGDGFSVDAQPMGNKTRRMNHASGAKANVSSQVVNHHGVRKVVMRAKCAIEAGAELQFDYMYGADARTCLRWRSRLQEPLDMTQSHGERMRGGVGAGEHSDTCEWAQCEEQSCEKWRRLPLAKGIGDFPTRFTCACVVESCDVVADAYDSSDEEVISSNTL